MKKKVRAFCAAMALAIGLACAGGAYADLIDDAAALPDRAEGKVDAPVTVIEYASLTCSHCADFQKKTLGKVRTDLIDTGKVRYIFRDFPLDAVGLKVAAMTRCMPEDSYHALIDVLYQNQEKWLSQEDPVKAAVQYAKLGGLNEKDAMACAESQKIMDAITAKRLEGEQKYGVAATPTFIMNEGKAKISGAQEYESFLLFVNRALPPGKKK